MVDLFAASAAARTEHYEIAAYEGLVTMAKAMGEPDAARLLEENLKQDKTMLRETNGLSRRLTRKAAKEQKDGRQAAAKPRQRSQAKTPRRQRSAQSTRQRARR